MQNQLVSFSGYDGYEQSYAYSALGSLLEKTSSGNDERTTLEDVITGGVISEREIGEQTTTSYIYDVTTYQLLTETTDGESISYAYGLERIAAYTENAKTEYIYDVRGSVAQAVTNNTIESYSYTPFGEQLGEAVSGFGYNAEYYDAATGMQYLRARYYEPEMMRFSQQDLVRGFVVIPISLNRYLYVQNNPVLYSDPSGMVASAAIRSIAVSSAGGTKNKVAKNTTSNVTSAAKVTTSVANTVSKVSTAVAKASNTVAMAASKIAANSNSKLVKSLANGVAKTANKVTTVAKKVEKVSTQIAKACDKIATDSWNEAKTNFASAARDFNEAAQEVKGKVRCAVSANTLSPLKLLPPGICAVPITLRSSSDSTLDSQEEDCNDVMPVWDFHVEPYEDNAYVGALYVMAEKLPYFGMDDSTDLYKIGLGSYKAGAATLYSQWKYGGVGIDAITGYANLNFTDFCIGINALIINGNVRLPVGEREVVIDGEVGVGWQLRYEFANNGGGFKFTAGVITFGLSVYVE